uniref:ATP-dependent helicase C-terminal domain-containing protein n=1 Tax=Panagrolaimus davidi TaxID=227884 RepID=A0A914PE82_9BILA
MFRQISCLLQNFLERLLQFLFKLAKDVPYNSESDTKTWELNDVLDKLKNDDLYFTYEDTYGFLADIKEIRSHKLKNGLDLNLPHKSIFVIQRFRYFMKYFTYEGNQKFYKCNVSFEKSKGKKDSIDIDEEFGDYDFFDAEDLFTKYRQINPIRPDLEATLNFWCMSPSVAFKDAFEDSHSVILASGTLYPFQTLKTELGFPFHSEMEGKQIIPDKQIFATVVSKSSNNLTFKFTYKHMEKNPQLYFELLQTICDVCKIVPKGILVFVSSYRILNEIKEHMKSENLKSDIEKHKKIFFESNESKISEEIFNEYSHTIKNTSSGAIMFAVFRGKFSEGIDFPDDLARCVICVGIPCPNIKDENLLQKKSF